MRRTIEKGHKEMLRWVDKNSGDWPSGAYFEMSKLAWNSLSNSPVHRPDMEKVISVHNYSIPANRPGIFSLNKATVFQLHSNLILHFFNSAIVTVFPERLLFSLVGQYFYCADYTIV